MNFTERELENLLINRRNNFFYALYVVLHNIEIFVESPVSRASVSVFEKGIQRFSFDLYLFPLANFE